MWWEYHHGFSFFPCVLFPIGFLVFFFLIFIVARSLFFRRFGAGCYGRFYGPWNHGFDAESILKRRLANGDITEEEYQRLKDKLKD